MRPSILLATLDGYPVAAAVLDDLAKAHDLADEIRALRVFDRVDLLRADTEQELLDYARELAEEGKS